MGREVRALRARFVKLQHRNSVFVAQDLEVPYPGFSFASNHTFFGEIPQYLQNGDTVYDCE